MDNRQIQSQEQSWKHFDDDFLNEIYDLWQPDVNVHNTLHQSEERVNEHEQFPFNLISRVISVFYDLPVKELNDFPYGTGTFIHPRVVITSAHNIYSKSLKALADHVYVQLEKSETTSKHMMSVKYLAIHREFMNENSPDNQQYDLAFLILSEKYRTKNSQKLNLNLKFDPFTKEKPFIFLSGYPKSRNLGQQKMSQYWRQITFDNIKDNFVTYKRS